MPTMPSLRTMPHRDLALLLAGWSVVLTGLIVASYGLPVEWTIGLIVLAYLLACSVVVGLVQITAQAAMVLWWVTVVAITLLFSGGDFGGLGVAFLFALVYGTLGFAFWILPALLVRSFLRGD